jgi:UDP-N-acetylmuramyl tripeptide synthase
LPQGNDVIVQLDRAAAIANALAQADANDVILLAGKGHETTQEVAGYKAEFSDVAHAKRALQLRSYGPGVSV